MGSLSRARVRGLIAGSVLFVLAGSAQAQLRRPLESEDSETFAWGRWALELGFEHERFAKEDPSPHERTGLPVVGLRLGLGPHAELQVDYGLLLTDPGIEDQGSIVGTGDGQVSAKLRLPWRPPTGTGLGFKFTTKLPNAGERNRLGTDETDVLMWLLADQDLGPARLIVNLGFGILGDVDTPQAQDDVRLVRLGLVWPQGRGEARLTMRRWALAGEWVGISSADPTLERFELRAGGRCKVGGAHADFGVGRGTGGVAPRWSARGGVTFLFGR